MCYLARRQSSAQSYELGKHLGGYFRNRPKAYLLTLFSAPTNRFIAFDPQPPFLFLYAGIWQQRFWVTGTVTVMLILVGGIGANSVASNAAFVLSPCGLVTGCFLWSRYARGRTPKCGC